MKKIKILSVVGLFAFNIVLLTTNAFAREAGNIAGITKGIKGTINGVDTCHCPDDSGECYCAQSN